MQVQKYKVYKNVTGYEDEGQLSYGLTILLSMLSILFRQKPACSQFNKLKSSKQKKEKIYITDFDKISNKTLLFSMFRGTWGPRQFCASGSFATGFVLRYAPLCASRCNFDDDTALMGIW